MSQSNNALGLPASAASWECTLADIAEELMRYRLALGTLCTLDRRRPRDRPTLLPELQVMFVRLYLIANRLTDWMHVDIREMAENCGDEAGTDYRSLRQICSDALYFITYCRVVDSIGFPTIRNREYFTKVSSTMNDELKLQSSFLLRMTRRAELINSRRPSSDLVYFPRGRRGQRTGSGDSAMPPVQGRASSSGFATASAAPGRPTTLAGRRGSGREVPAPDTLPLHRPSLPPIDSLGLDRFGTMQPAFQPRLPTLETGSSSRNRDEARTAPRTGQVPPNDDPKV